MASELPDNENDLEEEEAPAAPQSAPNLSDNVQIQEFKPSASPRPKTTTGVPIKKCKPRPTALEIKKTRLRARRTTDPSNPLLLHSYNQHRHRVETVRAQVDSSCPITARLPYTKTTSFNRRLATFSKIERDNAIMTKRISGILQGEATVDNHHKAIVRQYNGGKARELKLLKITFENLALLKRIEEQRPVYGRKEQLSEYERREEIMERLSYYPLYWKQKKIMGWEAYEETACKRAKDNPRPRVYLDLATDVAPLGRIIIELRADIVPMTAENFRALCTGEYGLTYKCSKIHRIIPNIIWQGGDVSGMDGYGNKSIYGDKFPNENFKLLHDKPGVVSMANIGEDSNGSQFIIDAREMPALDKKNVVVGCVIAGMEVLDSTCRLVTSTGRLRRKIWIHGCGELSPDEDINDYKVKPEVEENENENEEEEEQAEEAGNENEEVKEEEEDVVDQLPPTPSEDMAALTIATEE